MFKKPHPLFNMVMCGFLKVRYTLGNVVGVSLLEFQWRTRNATHDTQQPEAVGQAACFISCGTQGGWWNCSNHSKISYIRNREVEFLEGSPRPTEGQHVSIIHVTWPLSPWSHQPRSVVTHSPSTARPSSPSLMKKLHGEAQWSKHTFAIFHLLP